MEQSSIYRGERPWRGVLRRFMVLLSLAGTLMLATAFPVAATEGDGDRVEWFGGAPSDRWMYGGEVYLWGASVGGKSAAGDDIDIDFTDLVKDLEFGIMGTLAAAKGKWTLFADLIYMDVDDDTKTTANIIGVPVQVNTDVGLKAFTSTFGGAYSVLETDTTRLNLVAGARYLWLKGELKFDIGNLIREKVSDSGHNWDGIVGLRGKTDLNEKWYLTYYADVGTGDSDLTWQALAGINYRFEKVDAVFGYRYLDWDLDDNDVFDDLNLGGPFAGVKFAF